MDDIRERKQQDGDKHLKIRIYWHFSHFWVKYSHNITFKYHSIIVGHTYYTRVQPDNLQKEENFVTRW